MFNPALITPAHRCTDVIDNDGFTVGCSKPISLPGMNVITPDTADFYNTADVYVHFPDDGIDTALMAMAYAVPVIAVSGNSSSIPISDGIDGFIVKNKGQLVKILKKLSKDFELRFTVGNEGRKKVCKVYG